jgi:uncharacterized membrane protein YfcA
MAIAPVPASGLLAVAATGVAVGLINALSGGGSLLSFPLLTALGLPALLANATNTVALLPGYLGAALAQRRDLAGQGRRVLVLLPVALAGGLLGGALLLGSGEELFRVLVPWLILLGSLLLAFQPPLRAWLGAWQGRHRSRAGVLPNFSVSTHPLVWSLAPLLFASVYGGYFGAGLSVILLAVLALCFEDSLTRLNALKQTLALAANLSAALLFLALGRVDGRMALLLGVGALVGGTLGGRLAGRIDPERLRWLVVGIGVAVAALFWLRGAHL